MNVPNIEGLMRAMELEGTARIDIIRIGKDIQTAGHPVDRRRSNNATSCGAPSFTGSGSPTTSDE